MAILFQHIHEEFPVWFVFFPWGQSTLLKLFEWHAWTYNIKIHPHHLEYLDEAIALGFFRDVDGFLKYDVVLARYTNLKLRDCLFLTIEKFGLLLGQDFIFFRRLLVMSFFIADMMSNSPSP